MPRPRLFIPTLALRATHGACAVEGAGDDFIKTRGQVSSCRATPCATTNRRHR